MPTARITTAADRGRPARGACYGSGAALALLLAPPANAAVSPSVERQGTRHVVAESLGVAAAAWGVLMAVSPLLQIRRMLARRSSADVSIAYLAVLEFGFVLWIGYGISLGNPVIALPNSVAALVGAATMLVAWALRHGPRPA